MTNIPSNIVAFLIALGPLIFFHEAGHFLMAKLFRVRVLVFSFGFGKRLFGFRKGETDYRISLIPLGGYVRMSGDMPDDAQPPAPGDFLAKPKWQRFLILLAGPAMNLILAVGVLAVLNVVGVEVYVIKPVLGEILAGKPADKAGLKVGDEIVSVDGEPIKEFDDLRLVINMHAGMPLPLVYLRGGVRHTTTITPVGEDSEYGEVGKIGVGPFYPPVVGNVLPDRPAARSGIRPGDVITAANGKPVAQMTDVLDLASKSSGKKIDLDVNRAGQSLHVTLPAAPFDPKEPLRGLELPTQLQKLPFAEALRASMDTNGKILRYTFLTLKRLVTGHGSIKNFSGPATLARVSGDMMRQGGLHLIEFIAMISLQLGIMNLLPIPVLDGGHIMILMIEGTARRDLSIRAKERIQQFGLAVLAALMIVVLCNDAITNILLMRKG